MARPAPRRPAPKGRPPRGGGPRNTSAAPNTGTRRNPTREKEGLGGEQVEGRQAVRNLLVVRDVDTEDTGHSADFRAGSCRWRVGLSPGAACGWG